MRQTRLSIGCRDWQEIVRAIGPEAAGVLVYLRTLMRSMQASEISITLSELAETLRIPSDRAETALAAISSRYLERTDAGGIITLQSTEEEKQQADARRKRAARLLSRTSPGLIQSAAPRADGQSAGQSEHTFFDHNGQSANSPKEVYSEVAMFYDPDSVRQTKHALSDKIGKLEKKEKEPMSPQKEKSLTETRPAHASAPVHEAELPADSLEAEFIETIGSWPKSLRDALKAEPNDVREAFYLYVRTRQDEGERWTADRIRIAWLAARRIPAERRAESILAAAMGNWKTIRDAGSRCYYEKGSGKIVSLVRGPVEYSPKNATEKTNAELAVRLARSMRRD